MKRIMGTCILAAFTAVFCCQAASAVDLDKGYLRSINRYYDLPFDQVKNISDMGIAGEDIPVAFQVAKKADVPVKEIVKVRMRGDSWMHISRKYSLDASAFYIIVTGKVVSKNYRPTFDKFSGTPKNK